MDTRSTDSSWKALTAKARQALPPGDLDVRHSLRAALEAGDAAVCRPARPLTLGEELTALSQSWAMRFALGGCAALAAIGIWSALNGLGIALEMQDMLLVALF